MAEPTAAGGPAGKMVIRNVGLMLSGDLKRPILDADALIADKGRIVAFGREKDLDTSHAQVTIDAKGCALAPGLIDSHVHPVFGDWTPRQSQLGWIDSFLNGGVTTMISAGEVHLPGRPKDVVGVKALAITAQRSFDAFRPGGVKVLAGAPVIEKGMEESDFAEMAKAGVKLLGEVGLGTVKAGDEAKKMVAWARKYGIQSTIHTGGPSVPGSGYIDKDVVLEADADVIGHINGGHTALPLKQIECLCEQCSRAIEVVHNGNEMAGLHAVKIAKQNTCSAGRSPKLDSMAITRRMPSGCTPDPAGESVPRMTRSSWPSCLAIFTACNPAISFPLCTTSMARPHCSHRHSICFSGSAVWPPLMWPITSASASSTTSLSIRLEPGTEGPPVWMVLWMPCLRAQATICAASWPAFTEPRPISPRSPTPAAASSAKSCSTMPFSITGAPASTLTPPPTPAARMPSNARCAVIASALTPTMSLGRPGRCTSPAEIIVVTPPCRHDSIQPI